MYYLYNQEGKDLGPYTIDELKVFYDTKQFPSDKLVRPGDSKEWLTLGGILGAKAVRSTADNLAAGQEGCPRCHSTKLESVRKAPPKFISNIVGFILFILLAYGNGIIGAVIATVAWVIIDAIASALFSTQTLQCKECHHTWIGVMDTRSETPRPSEEVASSLTPLPPVEATFTFACSACAQHISTTFDTIGAKAECPNCGSPFTVPEPSS